MEPKQNGIYLIEQWWYEEYHLLACYDNLQAVIEHLNDPNFVREYGLNNKEISVRFIGVRSKKQLRPVCEKSIDYAKCAD